MQTDNSILAFIKREGWKRLIVYFFVVIFALKYAFGFINSSLRDYYTKDVEEKHLNELLMLDSQLQELETALSERGKVQKVEVQKSTVTNNKAVQNQKDLEQKIKVYEKTGMVIREGSTTDAVSSIDSLRAALKEQAAERKRRSNKSL
ncbi:hypothetical protein [Emticicia sp. W12TSBA100-4]|uniref:hypothetical protein n=1 Tax=Emticicia sp. W12TSBA100-4 TaxID=3160965 RepID=UPI00330682DA